MEILNAGLAMKLPCAGDSTAAAPSPQPQPQQKATTARSGSVPFQYSEQLAQMRKMGFFGERLSLIELRHCMCLKERLQLQWSSSFPAGRAKNLNAL